ncbi:Cof-type HAD-IIB family hydrolase [Mycoplasmopsis anatis]|uniref:YcsE-related riboflavin metabolism phosphatase n=1 Tax=Mycoplasmopsis anatis TaxID=171279 RepID=UPI001C4DF07F|nr:Cof-type HAD-IIB family hydrolase [Mycoplasmopsis anatis]MBW0594913.1 Cof-type HAD-IIB family hydrolase [Mycoplasmopsis anatis]MBW0598502.1 Cof-type HAD-IIB family hydrolase [Mycoplasmopsis anatis]MBW0599279.1 Cof-type HAD-IIB family hydrolase [Mycoplasmopsis anatis]MBW0600891.1 Cof-type HAD-IIB family hydrolase [Mycoplasmopsis anatis]MBW0603447.1 Cof-type HAD-IIB family hydrolase [Mycoplasmopsis anatis]
MKNLKDIIKCAAFDIDGTILPNGNTKFSEKTIELFSLLKKNNIVSILATAREFSTIGDFLEQLKPDYFIGANGSFILDCNKNEMIYEIGMKLNEVKKLYDEFYSDDCNFIITDINKSYYSENTNLDTWFIRPNISKYDKLDFNKIIDNRIYVITLSGNEISKKADLIDKFIKDNDLDMEINSTWSRGIFIGPKNITKSSTLKLLTRKIGFSNDNLIAFGDSSNDFEMIRDAVYGVAMERASWKIKNIATDITLDCEYDGAYLKLKELKLI